MFSDFRFPSYYAGVSPGLCESPGQLACAISHLPNLVHEARTCSVGYQLFADSNGRKHVVS
jgi:hypothetical protein